MGREGERVKDDPNEAIEYTTSVEGSLLIMKAINEMTFLERMQPIMEGVAKELIRAGVDFSKVTREREKGSR